MSHDHLTYEDLLRIVELIKMSDRFTEFRLKLGDIDVELRRRGAAGSKPPVTSGEAPHYRPASAQLETTDGAAPSSPPAPRVAPALPEGAIVVRSPMVGTFYRAPQPGAEAFVVTGQRVEPDTVVCIVEVMKLMNSIPAGAHGTVMQILVDDAAPVEAGQPLIVVQPDHAAA